MITKMENLKSTLSGVPNSIILHFWCASVLIQLQQLSITDILLVTVITKQITITVGHIILIIMNIKCPMHWANSQGRP